MPEDRFVDLYVRMERLSRRYAASPDSLRARRAELFRAQGTDQEEIERAIIWYRQRPDRGLRALEKIAKRLEAEEKSRIQETGDRIQNEKPSLSPNPVEKPSSPPPSPNAGREGGGSRPHGSDRSGGGSGGG